MNHPAAEPAPDPSVLPPLYAAWMDEVLRGPIPAETDATCASCAMCGPEAPPGGRFEPQSKCCTYLPELPNFLVGRILSDEDPAAQAGKATLIDRLQAGVAVTPLGVGRTPTYALLYRHSSEQGFGKSQSMRCPHYLEEAGGRCGVWRHRQATCATWFCRHVRGAVGMQFWKATHQLLIAVERSLAAWCVLELDLGPDALRVLFPPPRPASYQPPQLDGKQLDGVVDPASYRRAWGRWFGREHAFFETCGERVEGLGWRDVERIGGPELKIAAELVRDTYRKLTSTQLPEKLRMGRFQLVEDGGPSPRLASYSEHDLLSVARPLIGSLHRFDGRPTGEAMAAVAADGVDIDSALVRRLIDFQVLIPQESLVREKRARRR